MEIISNLIAGVFEGKNDIERIKYKYSEKISKHVWHGLAMKYIENLKIGTDNKQVWSELIKYAFADESCEYDLTKSIGIIGQTGSGKSITMDILNSFMQIDSIKYLKSGRIGNFSFKTVASKQIAGEYAADGYDIISKYSSMGCLCIDDLGSETTSTSHYGTKVNVIEEIIENRYLNRMITHFTSNIKPEQMRDIYGDRVYSRVKHMANIIIMNDCDYRTETN